MSASFNPLAFLSQLNQNGKVVIQPVSKNLSGWKNAKVTKLQSPALTVRAYVTMAGPNGTWDVDQMIAGFVQIVQDTEPTARYVAIRNPNETEVRRLVGFSGTWGDTPPLHRSLWYTVNPDGVPSNHEVVVGKDCKTAASGGKNYLRIGDQPSFSVPVYYDDKSRQGPLKGITLREQFTDYLCAGVVDHGTVGHPNEVPESPLDRVYTELARRNGLWITRGASILIPWHGHPHLPRRLRTCQDSRFNRRTERSILGVQS